VAPPSSATAGRAARQSAGSDASRARGP